MLMTTHWPVLVSDVSTTVAVTLASTLDSSGGMYWGFLATAPSDHELSAASTTTARTLAIMVPHNSPSSSKNESPSPNVTGHSSGSLTTNLFSPLPSTVVISAPTTWRLLSLSAAQTSFSRPGRSGALTITSAVHLSFTSTWMSACSPPRLHGSGVPRVSRVFRFVTEGLRKRNLTERSGAGRAMIRRGRRTHRGYDAATLGTHSSVRISSASSQEISPPRATTRPRCAGPLATFCDGKGT